MNDPHDDATRPIAETTREPEGFDTTEPMNAQHGSTERESTEQRSTAGASITDTTPTSPPQVLPTGASTGVIRPTGISWVTVTFGALCLGLAAVIVTVQLSDLVIDWSIATPAFVVGTGVLLVLLGLASLVRGKAGEG